MKLTLPLKEQQSASEKMRSIYVGSSEHDTEIFTGEQIQSTNLKRGVVQWFFGGDENYGSEDFLVNARNILIRLKTCKVNERRKKDLLNEIVKMKQKESLNDKIKNIERILQHSFSQPSNEYVKNEFI